MCKEASNNDLNKKTSLPLIYLIDLHQFQVAKKKHQQIKWVLVSHLEVHVEHGLPRDSDFQCGRTTAASYP